MKIKAHIDREIKDLLVELPAVETITTHTTVIRNYLKEVNAKFNASLPKNKAIAIENRRIPGLEKGLIPVRMYSPLSKQENIPALLWFHGGGFILGDLDTDDHWCAAIAHEVGCCVVSVDYRLAPEYPFPAGVEDCYAALLWLVSMAGEFGIDTARIGVAGASAGGNLAASVALMARDQKGPGLAFQFLIYPCLDDRHATPSSFSITDKRLWHRQMSLQAWEAYLGENHSTEVSCYAAPSRAKNLAGLPPAYISAAELDLLRDEDILYATRLMQSGINTELHVFPGVVHGFEFFFQDTLVSKKTRTEYLAVLKKALARPLA